MGEKDVGGGLNCGGGAGGEEPGQEEDGARDQDAKEERDTGEEDCGVQDEQEKGQGRWQPGKVWGGGQERGEDL